MDVFVGKGVVDELSGPAEPDQVGVAEDAELVGDGGLAHTEGLLQLADGEFSAGQEGAEDAHSGVIAHDLQELAGGADLGRRRVPTLDCRVRILHGWIVQWRGVGGRFGVQVPDRNFSTSPLNASARSSWGSRAAYLKTRGSDLGLRRTKSSSS